MKKIFFAITLLFTTMLFSQNQGVIKGTITDQAMNNEPMLFANVQLKGSDTSYQTNFHGNFEIVDIKPGNYTLVISYLGYDTEELAVLVEENTISKIETNLSPLQISFEDVSRMDVALKEEIVLPSETEEHPKK